MSGIETAGSDGEEVLGTDHPLVCGAVPLPPPLTTTAPLLLNTHQLSWEAVEHLVAALALKVDQAREARLYGRRGQDQQGIDVVAFFDSRAPTVYQAKNYKSFTAGDLRAAVVAFTDGRRPFQAGRLVVVTTASVADTRIDEELAVLRERHSDLQIDLWGQQQLSDLLYEEPGVVRRFFGEATMQVFCRPLAAQDLSPSGVAKLDEVKDYLRELSASLAIGLHEHVSLNVRVEQGNDTLPSIDLATWLREGGHAQLVGPSGSGKSHTMAHTAVELAGSGCFPILVRAGVYQGRLEPWLDEAVAPYSTYRATELIDTVRRHGYPVIVLVDATNECPETLRTTLVEQLSAWCRRTGATVMACGQNYLDVPTALSGARLCLLAPDTDQRKALLRSYGAEDIEERCDAFNTPLELALAARLAHQLPMRAGRAELLDAFVRDRLRTCTRPTVIRHVLQRWALLMDQRLMTWLPLAEAERVAVRELTQHEVSMSVVEEILSSPLVEVSRHRVGFCHELFGRLFTAEELMRQHMDPVELAAELARPQHREIRELALPLEGNPEKLIALLSTLCDGKILTEALQGRLGQLADEVTYIEARRILDDATKVMSTARVVFPSDFASTFSCRVEMARRPWSDYEVAMFGAVGATAHDGRMLDKLLELLRQTDVACRRDTEGSRGTRQQVSPSMIASVLCGPVHTEPQRLPADHIFKSMEFHLPASRNAANFHGYVEACALVSALETVRSEDIGTLLMLCRMVSCADDAGVVRLMPALLAKAWESGAYHLRLEGLKSVMSVRSRADVSTTAQIIEQLEVMTTDNIWLSTSLVDALNVYGLVESPFTVEDIASDIDEVLAYPEHPDAQTRAGAILNSQFEDFIAEPFVEAVSALNDAQRTSLYVLATSSGDAHLFTSVYLRELLRAGDSAAMVSYQHWALSLNVDNPVPQETVACHLLGIQGCAAHTDTPPELLTEHHGPDAEAWRCYGQILFWLHRPDLPAVRRDEYCRPLWRLLTTDLCDAAVDPLRKMRSSVLFSDDLPYAALGRLMETFPSGVREILHHGLAAPQRVTSLFAHAGLLDSDDVVIQLTAEVGDASSLPYLKPYIDDPGVGVSAVQALRRIKRRIEG